MVKSKLPFLTTISKKQMKKKLLINAGIKLCYLPVLILGALRIIIFFARKHWANR